MTLRQREIEKLRQGNVERPDKDKMEYI